MFLHFSLCRWRSHNHISYIASDGDKAWPCGAAARGCSHGHGGQGLRGEAVPRDPLPPVRGRGTLGLYARRADWHPGLFHDPGSIQIQLEPGDRPNAPPTVRSPPTKFLLLHCPLISLVAMDSTVALIIKFRKWGLKSEIVSRGSGGAERSKALVHEAEEASHHWGRETSRNKPAPQSLLAWKRAEQVPS